MNSKTDEELVLAIQQGDISAFEELIERFQRGLYFFVIRILKNEAQAADIVQDSFVTVYKVIDRIDIKRKFSTYLFEIAKNAAFSYLRKQKRMVSLDAIAELEQDESFIEHYLREDVFEGVRIAVKALPDKYRRVITLYYFEELTYEEVSWKLQIPVNTVRTHLKRAKEQLKHTITL